jgi:hypothetical protein
MRVTDTVTGQRLTVDEAYQRFFDGFYNLGKPSDSFQGTMVLGSPQGKRVKVRRRTGTHRRVTARRAHRDSGSRK